MLGTPSKTFFQERTLFPSFFVLLLWYGVPQEAFPPPTRIRLKNSHLFGIWGVLEARLIRTYSFALDGHPFSYDFRSLGPTHLLLDPREDRFFSLMAFDLDLFASKADPGAFPQGFFASLYEAV